MSGPTKAQLQERLDLEEMNRSMGREIEGENLATLAEKGYPLVRHGPGVEYPRLACFGCTISRLLDALPEASAAPDLLASVQRVTKEREERAHRSWA